ncbi:UDP-N-acetylmuramate--L-alanine ligase [Solicola sp. PLA-1-18]|uniref:UDP-N-acetylmuramate--L-alanine ligase n=1 Tax=Solicola sp. PLA-1-18 TaxID=3380532 RepID=UPI003B78A35A
MRLEVPLAVLPPEELGRVHLVGIGGAGLSAIARLLMRRGVPVSGSDGQDSVVLRALAAEGARTFVGHDASQVEGVDTLVVSTAVREDNPEVVEARRLGLRLYPRSAGLLSLMLGRSVIAVAGTHGKTTTTSMLTSALLEAGLDPTYAIGAEVATLGGNAGGDGEPFVAEADESDGAFLEYRPHGAVVTNVDADHLDTWGTEEAYEAAFADFVARVEDDGFVVAVTDDPGAARLADLARGRGLRVVGVGTTPDADLRATDLHPADGGTTFAVERAGERLGTVTLAVPGRHYVLDALAALAAGLETGAPFDALAVGLGRHAGARRRMERIGEAAGVRVYDSYAHHPTEIVGDLEAARSLAGDGRLVVAYQPHLVSRTRLFGARMGEALGGADVVVVADLYLAREDPDPAVTSALVLDAVPAGTEAHAGRPLPELAEQLHGLARPGDLVLTLGAGDVTTVAPALLGLLERS